ncbi:MAG: methyltransferase domain-containing protein, partial [Proteobacteria bacterium]|nr:methyltransferase domain-containing protein [Pseudomonadota bacterium]
MNDGEDLSLHGIRISPGQLELLLSQIKLEPVAWLRTPWIRRHLADLRLNKLTAEDFRVYGIEAPDVLLDPQEYLENYRDYLRPERKDRLITPLGTIDIIRVGAPKFNLLTIGPLGEAELLAYMGIGFDLENIHGVDLVSHNSLVQTGDMHHLPFADNFFHLVVLGWSLSYSKNPQRVADEVMRVSGTGRYIAVGADYAPGGRTP